MTEWYAQLPGGVGLVRVERITYPSKGDVESTCLCRVLSWDGTEVLPNVPPVRIAVRELEMRM